MYSWASFDETSMFATALKSEEPIHHVIFGGVDFCVASFFFYKYTLQSYDDLELFLPKLSSEEKFSSHLNASAHLLLSGVCIAQFIL